MKDGERQLAAGIIPICKITGRILLGRRSMDSHYPGVWGLFGGTFEEEDMNPKVTAKREFFEETKNTEPYCISKTPVHISKNNFTTYYTYIALFDCEFEPYVNGIDKHSQEHTEYGWFFFKDLPENMIPELMDTFRDNAKILSNIISSFKKKY